MRKNLIISIAIMSITYSLHTGDDLRKLREAQTKVDWAMLDLWLVTNLSTPSDTPKTKRNQKKAEEMFINYTRAAIRKELELEKKILGKRTRAKL